MNKDKQSQTQTTLIVENPNYIEEPADARISNRPRRRINKRTPPSRSRQPRSRQPRNSDQFNEMVTVHLADQIKSGKRKTAYGVTTTATVSNITSDTAEYLYLTNSFIKRGIRHTTNAMLRNSYEITATNKADEETIAIFRKHFDNKLQEICDNTLLHGFQLIELFMGAKDKGVMTALVPPKESDFKRDSGNNVLYTKDGIIEGYVQTRSGQNIAEWSSDTIANVRFETISGSEIGISILQSAIYPATEYGLIRGNTADSFIRGLPVVHIIAENATPEDMSEISSQMARQFTAETVYITSDRFDIKNVSATMSSMMDIYNFIEPSLADIAACFYMPVEMLTNVKNIGLNDNVFQKVYEEWIQTIREKQATLAYIMETEVYNRITSEPVSIKFNSPQNLEGLTLIKNVGFAVQSHAITEEQAQKILSKAQVFGVDIDDDI